MSCEDARVGMTDQRRSFFLGVFFSVEPDFGYGFGAIEQYYSPGKLYSLERSCGRYITASRL